MNRLQRLNAAMVKKNVPAFEIGDTVRVHVKVVEGEKDIGVGDMGIGYATVYHGVAPCNRGKE